MNIKKGLCVLILLILCLSISTVSAEDITSNNDTFQESSIDTNTSQDTPIETASVSVESSNEIESTQDTPVVDSQSKDFTSHDDEIDKNEYSESLNNLTFNDESVAISNFEKLNSNEGIATFTDLQNTIDGAEDNITLTQNVTMAEGESTNFVNGITISKDITINGNGFTINANNFGRIFNIEAGILTLNNVVLINGKSTRAGGAIYNNEDGGLVINNCSFINNTANNGGAIYNSGPNFTINNSNFINNIGTGYSGKGGAVCNYGADNFTVINSNFTNNSASYGGAVCNYAFYYPYFNIGGGDNVVISNCIFINNSGSWGGSLFNNLGKNVTINNSTFNNNSGTWGGVIKNDGENFTISNSTFNNNSGNYGGVINNADANLDITGSTFNNNSAHKGGVIVDNDESSITINNSNFTNNQAYESKYTINSGKGGVVYAQGNVTIYDSLFENNTAVDGGAAYNTGNLTVENTEFTKNTPEAIYNDANVDLAITNFTDLQNAIATVDGVLTLTQNVTMTDDEATNFVNGIAINKDITINGNGHVIDAKELGRIFNIGEYTVTLVNVALVNGNVTEGSGGAIYINKGKLTLNNVSLVNNTADYSGGAIYSFSSNYLTINNSKFINNTAKINGGDIGNGGGANFIISNSTFINSRADGDGGSICNINGANFTISNSTFTNSYSGGEGGVIYNMPGAGFTIIDSTFENNTAKTNGGVIYHVNGVDFTISNSTFTNNTVKDETGKGGVIYISGGASDVKISDSTFSGNDASQGGAVYNSGNLTVSNSTFENNNAAFGVDVYNAETGILNLSNNEYTLVTGDKTNVYNVGNLVKVEIIVLGNGTVKVGYNEVIELFATITTDGASVAGKNLTFTLNGTNIKAESLLNGSYVGNYSSKILSTNVVSATYDGVCTDNVTVKNGILEVIKANPKLNIDTSNIYVEGLEIITVNINSDAEGLITLYINSTFNQTLPIYQGQVKFYLQNLSAGKYDILVNYTGDKNYNNFTNTTSFEVFKRAANLAVEASDVIYGADGIVLINLPSDITTTVKVIINENRTEDVSITNGFGKLILSDLAAGKYDISVEYAGNYKYLNNVTKATLNVAQATPSVNVTVNDIKVDENETVTINLPEDINGYIWIGIDNGVLDKVTVKDGVATKTYESLAAGNHTIFVKYDGNDNYTGVEFENIKFNVAKLDANISGEAKDIIFGDNETITVNLPTDAKGSVNITVDGKSYIVKVENGKANTTISGLNAGSYDVTVKYSGDNRYNECSE